MRYTVAIMVPGIQWYTGLQPPLWYRSHTNLGVRLRHLTFKGGQVLILKLVTYLDDELPRSRCTPKGYFYPPTD